MHAFDYAAAFERNLGIFTAAEQERLRESHVAIAGMGGAGGLFAHALARAGVGRFSLADGDCYELANMNRQIACNIESLGCNKAEVVAGELRTINPEIQARVWDVFLDAGNIDAFLEGADLVINAIDVFSVPAHRLLYRAARRRHRHVLFAAPLGFTCGMLCFAPDGPEPDAYFDWNDRQQAFDQTVHLILGTAPAGLHLYQIDMDRVNLEAKLGPSFFGACLLCAGVVAAESVRLLLSRKGSRPVPWYLQFDPLTGHTVRGCLRLGNRHPLQRLKKWWVLRRYRNRVGNRIESINGPVKEGVTKLSG